MSDEKRSSRVPELPDLDLKSLRALKTPRIAEPIKIHEAGPAPAQRAPSVRPASGVARGLGMGVVELDAEDLDGFSGIEIADGHVARPAVSTGPSKSSQNLPTGTTPDLMQIQVSPDEARTLAAYGATPRLFLLTPLYTWRVFWRKRRLLHEFQRTQRQLAAAENTRDQVLADLVNARRTVLECDERFERAFEPIYALEQTHSENSRAVAKNQAELNTKVAEIEQKQQKIVSLQPALAERIQVAQTELSAAETQCLRAEAKVKRVQIEMRALAERQGPASSAAPSAERQNLDERHQQAAQEHAVLRQAFEASQAKLANAEAELKKLQRENERLTRERGTLEHAFSGKLRSGQALAAQSAEARQKALADIGRALLGTRTFNIPEHTLNQIYESDVEVRRLLQLSQTHLLAIDLYDHEREKQGRSIGYACGAVLIVLLLALKFG